VRIDVLGPLEVTDGDRAVPVVGQRQRALLAALALELGKAVPVAGLVEALWGANPPVTARTKLQAHVSALRKAFGQDVRDEGPLVTRAPGYLLRSGDVNLDLSVFEAQTTQGREALQAGRCVAASELFAAALALWRGPAFADIDSALIRGAAEKLQERRLRALEDKAEADLATGCCDNVVAEVWPSLTANPFRERLRAMVMIALYRLGCRAEALALYLDGHRVMVAELGLEPGPQLRDLHQRILADDPALAPVPLRGGPVIRGR
jgi:DNA-binding SARP family transcriptional activator